MSPASNLLTGDMPTAKRLHSGASTRNQHTTTSTSTALRRHIAAFAACLAQRSAGHPSAPAVVSHVSNTGICHRCVLHPRESQNQHTATSMSTARHLHFAAFAARLVRTIKHPLMPSIASVASAGSMSHRLVLHLRKSRCPRCCARVATSLKSTLPQSSST